MSTSSENHPRSVAPSRCSVVSLSRPEREILFEAIQEQKRKTQRVVVVRAKSVAGKQAIGSRWCRGQGKMSRLMKRTCREDPGCRERRDDHWAAISASSRALVALKWKAGKKQENAIWKQAQQILGSCPCVEASCREKSPEVLKLSCDVLMSCGVLKKKPGKLENEKSSEREESNEQVVSMAE